MAARRLGIAAHIFQQKLPDLLARGFPDPDPTTGNFDLKAIEAWQDSRSGLSSPVLSIAKDAGSVISGRIARLSVGG